MESFWKKSAQVVVSELAFFGMLILLFWGVSTLVAKDILQLQELSNTPSLHLENIASSVNTATATLQLALVGGFFVIFLLFTLSLSFQIYRWYKRRFKPQEYGKYALKAAFPSFLLLFFLVDFIARIFNNIEGFVYGDKKIFFLHFALLFFIFLLLFYFIQFLFIFLLQQKFIDSLKRGAAAFKKAHLFLPLSFLFFILFSAHLFFFLAVYPAQWLIFLLLSALIVSSYKILFFQMLRWHKII